MPDFDITLVREQERILYPPNQTILKRHGKVVAIHGKGQRGQECVTLVDPVALTGYSIGIHHYAKNATHLKYVELYEFKNDGTTEVLQNYQDYFKSNATGNESAPPQQDSQYWVLIPITKILAGEKLPLVIRKADSKGANFKRTYLRKSPVEKEAKTRKKANFEDIRK